MVLDDIADYLTSQGGSGVGTLGTDLFKGFMPDTPDIAVAIYETGGLEPERAMTSAAGQVVVERPRVQVVARAQAYDYQVARTRIHNAFVLLEGMAARSINGTAYKYGSAVQSPFPMGRDSDGRVLICCNFDIVKALSTSTST